jgi:hypothetical protein
MGQLHMLNAMRVDGVKVVAGADKSEKKPQVCRKIPY